MAKLKKKKTLGHICSEGIDLSVEKVEVSWQTFVDMFMSKHILNKSKSEWFQLKVVTCREMSRHF